MTLSLHHTNQLVGNLAICMRGMLFYNEVADNFLEWLILTYEQGYEHIYMQFYPKIPPDISKIIG